MSLSPLTIVAISFGIQLPDPNCPSQFLPKVYTRPVSVRKAECVEPNEQSIIRCFPSSLIGIGVSECGT